MITEEQARLNLTDDQVKAMMTWQMHAATWVVSQAIALTRVASREDLQLGEDDVLSASVALYRLAREDDRMPHVIEEARS